MTFEEAKKKMKEIARGKYHSLSYELTVFHTHPDRTEGSEAEVNCRLYLDPKIVGEGQTWAIAFKNLMKGINPRNNPKPDLTEQPGEDVGEPKGKEENGE